MKRSELFIATLGFAAILSATGGCSRSQQSEVGQSPPADTRHETITGGEETANGQALQAWNMVTKAKRRVETLSVEDVAKEQTTGALIVDLRETEERFAHGAIPGAVHAPRGMLEFWADPASPVHRSEFDPSRRIILHCAVGGRSALAAATLKDMGYTNVAQLDGGFAAWRAAGKPVEPVTALSDEIVKVTGVAPGR